MDLQSQIEQFVRISGQPVSAIDVQKGLEEKGVDLTQYVDSRSSILATVQKHLEAFPTDRVTKRVSPDGGTTFQWISRSDPAPGSLASRLKG
jgi:hypothetical protein